MSLQKFLICVILIGSFIGCGEQLELIDGFPPPSLTEEKQKYSLEDLEINTPGGLDGMRYEFDFARFHNKPVLINFTGFNCVNCRKMEQNVWLSEEVFPILRDELIIFSLYVDDRDVVRIVDDNNEVLYVEPIGETWINYQKERYNRASQPLYDIVNFDNESLVKSVATYSTHGTPEAFKVWLLEGLGEFKKQNPTETAEY